MNYPASGLANCLVTKHLISATQVARAIEIARHKQISLATQLVNSRSVASGDMAAALSKLFTVPYLDISAFDDIHYPLELVKWQMVEKHRALPLSRRSNRLFLAIGDPGELSVISEFEFHTGMKVEPVVVAIDELTAVIGRLQQRQENRISADADTAVQASINLARKTCKQKISSSGTETSIVQMVNRLLRDAVRRSASDIHLEPYENSYRIRFRIDGTLVSAQAPNVALSARIASRLKVMGKLDIAERRIPQDGRMSMRISAERVVNIRVSTLPTSWGEKIVLRLLDSEKSRPALEQLGLLECQLDHYRNALRQQQGMVLISGPTGSGKSVSLYAGLNMLNSEERNISTVEDPIELSLEGINQVAVNSRVGLDFAAALRAFLRQDPDVVMVGEIRDLETAEIAVRAAQTGHLLLSTLHTNSAAEIVTRLRSMGIPPYNLATSVRLVIAQRLARLLCRHCKESHDPPENLFKPAVFNSRKYKSLQIFKAVGCERCNDGFKGRIGIYEVVPITPTMTEIIMGGGNAIQLAGEARKEGFPGLREAALFKVAQGLISLDEAYRLT